jgi:hypothetical protein
LSSCKNTGFPVACGATSIDQHSKVAELNACVLDRTHVCDTERFHQFILINGAPVGRHITHRSIFSANGLKLT